jgi:hypothetical protein
MSSPTQVFNNQLNQSVQSGQITSDQAAKKKLNILVSFILWIAESSPMVTAFTAVGYTMGYFIGVDPLDLINSSILRLIMNLIILFCATVTIVLTLFMDLFIAATRGVINTF